MKNEIISMGLKDISWLYGPYSWIRDNVCNGNKNAAIALCLAVITVVLLAILIIIISVIKKSKKKKANTTDNTLKQTSKTETIEKADENIVEEVEKDKNNEEVIVENDEKEEKNDIIEKEEISSNTSEYENVLPENEEIKVEENIEEKEEESMKEVKKTTAKVEKPAAKKAAPAKQAPVKKESAAKPASKVVGKYEIVKVNDSYLYRLKASNGEILVTSELYTSLKGAKAAINTVIKNVSIGDVTISKDKHNLYQFKLFGANKRLLVVSANYPTETRCQSAAESFKKFAVNYNIVEFEEDPEHLLEEIKIESKETKKGGKIVISSEDGVYDFKLQANNGTVICSSNEFTSKASTISGIDTLKDAIKTGKFFVLKDKRDMYQFKLYSSSGRAVVYGEVYKNKTQAVSAANSVASFISLAEIVESN